MQIHWVKPYIVVILIDFFWLKTPFKGKGKKNLHSNDNGSENNKKGPNEK